jgi:hypothetical protein
MRISCLAGYAFKIVGNSDYDGWARRNSRSGGPDNADNLGYGCIETIERGFDEQALYREFERFRFKFASF